MIRYFALFWLLLVANLCAIGQSETKGSPQKPKPPACCTPFRTTAEGDIRGGAEGQGQTFGIMGNPDSFLMRNNFPSGTISSTDRLIKYLHSLENYRAVAEQQKFLGKITEAEFVEIIDNYRERYEDYELHFSKLEPEEKIMVLRAELSMANRRNEALTRLLEAKQTEKP